MRIALQYHRRATSQTQVGGVSIGSDSPIRLQTMANTSTNDIAESVAQALRCARAGAELIRFTTQGKREVESLTEIHRVLREEHDCRVPLVADIHFQSDVADVAAVAVEKVRINPGNYSRDAAKLEERFVHLLDLCKAHGTALRIGVNHGSLSERMMDRYGDTPQGMVESVMEFLRIAVDHDFRDIVISVKASNTRVMVETVRLLVATMERHGMAFPLHLGVTEAGEGEDGRIKSAVGIGALLADGIGDTIRVSLSEAPENELPVARALRDYFAAPDSIRYTGTAVSVDGAVLSYRNEEPDWALFQLHAAAECGRLLWAHQATELHVENPHFSPEALETLSRDILQAARIRIYKTEYISCPGCGRTLFDLQKTIAEVKRATADLSGLKIAVMGCIVNGPGEMADADYGYVGAGRDRISLYRGKECVLKNIPQEEAVEQLLRLIENDDKKH